MLLNDKEANERLSSSNNLLNKMRERTTSSNNGNGSKGKAMSLFGMGATSQHNQISKIEQKKDEIVYSFKSPFTSLPSTDYDPDPPSLPSPIPEIKIDDIMNNADSKIKIETAHNEALDAMVKSVQQLKIYLPGMESPQKLADIASKMSKIVTDIRKERLAIADKEGDRSVHLHLYSPEQKKLDQFEVIDV